MGRVAYELAYENPDNLADVISPNWVSEGIDAEAEIYAAATQAWMKVTGETNDAAFPSRQETVELAGEPWDFEDDAETAKRLPRLFRLYDEHDDAL